ncbi:MAG: hypothetical protein ACRD12_18600 [Acidimicrobiales bacterium]
MPAEAAEPEVIEFEAADTAELVRHMEALTETHEGWINLEPEVYADEEDVPQPRRGLLSVFAPPAPSIPLGTWTPAPPSKRGRAQPATVGLQHPTGKRAKLALLDAGHPVPRGWVVLQDHARRGLVLAVPPEVGHAEMMAWLMRAGALLSVIPVTGRWKAAVYTP